MGKERLDCALVNRGLAESRENQPTDMVCIVNLTEHQSLQQSDMHTVHLPCNHPFSQSDNLHCD